jgi:Ca2+-binding EF-hand superfamily protein|eukprot:g8994.t1
MAVVRFVVLLAQIGALFLAVDHGAADSVSESQREPFSAPLDPNQGRLKRPPNMDFYGSHPATLPGKSHPHGADDKERELTKDEIMSQLRSQGVKEGNIEKMAEDIMVENKKKNIESHDHDPNTVHEDASNQRLNDVSMDDDNHPLASANLDLLPQPVLRKNFNKADTDHDGKLYIEELIAHFKHEIDRVDIEKFKIRLKKVGGNPEAYDGERGVMMVKQVKKHLRKQIEGANEGFAAADVDKDGYIRFKEYVKFMQYESEKAIEKAKSQGQGDMEEEFSNWREEL